MIATKKDVSAKTIDIDAAGLPNSAAKHNQKALSLTICLVICMFAPGRMAAWFFGPP